MNSSSKLYVIDTQQFRKFNAREKIKLNMPDSILEEYALRTGEGVIKMGSEMSPFAEYTNAEGYEFTWGTILERRVDAYIIWDYCFSQLLTHYLRHGKRLSDMQRAIFYELERTVDYTTRDIYPVLGMTKGFRFIPSSSVGGFTQVIHFTSEKEAKGWTIDNLLYQTLPNLIEKFLKDVPVSHR
jgi:hypothetical protein